MATDPVFIIAEAGVNHNGSVERALKMVDLAADAGADAIKFQSFKAENLVTGKAPKAEYQNKNSQSSESQLSMLKGLELPPEAYTELISMCRKRGIEFLSSPFDMEAIEYLFKLRMAKWKIPSGEITNLPYLRRIAALDKEVILSTGMSNLNEIGAALDVLTGKKLNLNRITILHCNTEYPTPMTDVNLLAMKTIKKTFPGVKVGYSDHTSGIEISLAAASMGASVIEKHFTSDRTLPGPDHKASLNPEELRQMVLAIRNIERAFGSGIKVPSPSEKKNIPIARKSIVAALNIKKGQLFSPDNLTVKRPGTGISPMKWDNIIGKNATKDYKKDDIIHG